MRYWPFSVLRTSPLLPQDCAAELDAYTGGLKLSKRACTACVQVLKHTKAIAESNLIVTIDNVTMRPSMTYTSRPTQEQWTRLERINVVQGFEGSIFILATPLH
jgi:hypothetical protein